MERNTPDMKEV